MKHTKTQKVIAAMLKENTGTHFLDSGGAYGRHWQLNQTREFANEPRATTRFAIYGERWECEFTINVFHFLCKHLEYDAKIQSRFNRYAKRVDPENDKSYFELVDAFIESLNARGIYNEGNPVTVNTYNGEDALSQTIQYTYFTFDNTAYIALMVHGGCDVRGGYTAPKFFQTFNYDETGIFDNARGTLCCARGHAWDTDNAGYKWYPANNEPKLDNVDFVAFDKMNVEQNDKFNAVREWYHDTDKMDALPGIKKTYPALNLLVIDNDTHVGYCPVCGEPLRGDMF